MDVKAPPPGQGNVLARVPLRVLLVVVVLGCWWLAESTGTHDLEQSTWYRYGTSLLLAIGLFASTAGIDRREAAAHKGLIISAVTIGVVLKAALIGGVLYLASRDPLFLVLGVAVAQIDPLSVAAILGDNRMSARAKTILASWASFDDPVTVLLVVYAAAVVGNGGGEGTLGSAVASGAAGYGVELALNLALAGAAYLAWRLLRRAPVVLSLVLGLLAAVAVWQVLMLGVAIAGLFVRPAWLERWLPRVTNTALLVAGGVLGLLLVNGVNVWYGLALGVMAFLSQIVAGGLLTFGLPGRDRLHLALAQQNGITAIILALQLEVDFDGAVAVIAPAILVTNTVHFVVNWLVDKRRQPQAES
jgi:NhaP-type Na+/H+ or K+/H+ antiporter